MKCSKNLLEILVLISFSQSAFVNQLLSITHLRGVFLDILNAFGKVCHRGLIHKLEQNGIGGLLFKILTDSLKPRKQRVALNG